MTLFMWWIIASLILLGAVLVLVELLIIPGVGFAGVAGLLSLIGACWYSFAYVSTVTGYWVTSCVLASILVMMFFILRAKTWKRFELEEKITSKVNVEADRLRVGDCGVAQTRLAPMGTGKFAACTCEVKSADNSMIAAGTGIEVVDTEDHKILVKPTVDRI